MAYVSSRAGPPTMAPTRTLGLGFFDLRERRIGAEGRREHREEANEHVRVFA